jgi:two-component system response regulator BaeR
MSPRDFRRSVVIVEDDPKIRAVLADYLTAAGHEPRPFGDGRAALKAIMEAPPAAIILDLTLPGLDGMAVCGRVRQHCAAPILMLTAKVEEADRLNGLDAGADDYVCKPFSAREVVARINALIRRAEGRVTSVSAAQACYAVDEFGQRAAWGGQWLSLSPTEFQILASLMRQPGRVFTRGQLLDRSSDHFRDVSDRAIDSHIKNIRRKIAAVDPSSLCVASVYGVGYRFDPQRCLPL